MPISPFPGTHGDDKHRNSTPAVTTFTNYQISIRQWKEIEDILTTGSK